MKKMVSFLLTLGLVLSLSACGNEQITIQEIYDASQTEAMLKNHQSVTVRFMEDGECYMESYLTKDYSYEALYDDEYGWEDLWTDRAYYAYYNGGYEYDLILFPDGLVDMASYRAGHFGSVVFGEFVPGETIQSVTKKDGRITVASVMAQESLAEVAEGLVACSCEYVLDAKTRELISASIVDTYDDGEVYHGTVEFIYDGELPGRGKELLNYANQTENLRTITVVSNPGTTEENIRSVQVVKGVLVVPYTESSVEEDFCVYSDAACTQDYDFSEGDTSDVTIYVKWGE